MCALFGSFARDLRVSEYRVRLTTHTAVARPFTSRKTASTMNADVPGAVQILAELYLRDLSLPRRHTAEHTYPTRSSDSRRSARRAPYRISAPHRPLSACAAQACSSSAWLGPDLRTEFKLHLHAGWCLVVPAQHLCAAGSPGIRMGRIPRRKPR